MAQHSCLCSLSSSPRPASFTAHSHVLKIEEWSFLCPTTCFLICLCVVHRCVGGLHHEQMFLSWWERIKIAKRGYRIKPDVWSSTRNSTEDKHTKPTAWITDVFFSCRPPPNQLWSGVNNKDRHVCTCCRNHSTTDNQQTRCQRRIKRS